MNTRSGSQDPAALDKTALDDGRFDAALDAHALMSLALDGLLDDEEEARLHALVAADESLGEVWRQWQKMDALLESAGAIAAVPEPGFLDRFEQALGRHEERQRARRRILFGAAAVVAWVGTVTLAVTVCWIMVSNQTQWMNGFVRELVYYPSAVSIWGRAVRSTLSATISEPQSVAIVAAYALTAALLLSTWLWFLRRTTQEEVVS